MHFIADIISIVKNELLNYSTQVGNCSPKLHFQNFLHAYQRCH